MRLKSNLILNKINNYELIIIFIKFSESKISHKYSVLQIEEQKSQLPTITHPSAIEILTNTLSRSFHSTSENQLWEATQFGKMNRNRRTVKHYKQMNQQSQTKERLDKLEFLERIVKREMQRSLLPSVHVKDIDNFISDSGKMDLLYRLMMGLRRDRRKVLIFTQMTRMLNLLERMLSAKGFTYVRLDGSVPAERRQILVQQFNQNPKVMVFISSTRVGGVGINLTSADTVVFYDNDWNPAIDKQAQDRCHRIGQNRDVVVYRLVTEFTIEENILATSRVKSKMDDLVLNKGQFNLLRLFESRNKKNKEIEVFMKLFSQFHFFVF